MNKKDKPPKEEIIPRMDSPLDWQEDFSKGIYANECKTCRNLFYGSKYRRYCKKCSTSNLISINMKTGIQLITEERERQISEEKWTPDHDDTHMNGELVKAAICYAKPETDRVLSLKSQGFVVRVRPDWPWDSKWWKPTPNDRIRELTKAGALVAAEIDRLQRKQKNMKNNEKS